MDSVKQLTECFPPVLQIILRDVLSREICEDIHIARERRVFLKLMDGIKFIEHRVSSPEFDHILRNLCRGSLYAQSENIKNGFISFCDGVRVGVSGRAVCEGDKIVSLSRIDSLNIRLPHYPMGIAEPLVSILEHFSFLKGVLIYSPPSVGKTTLLRDSARILSCNPYYKRVSLIDSRGELTFPQDDAPTTLDVYRFYPPRTAIECALRTMSTEIIVCDEIGGERELDALMLCSNRGVPVLASAHGENIVDLMKNETIYKLHKTGMFACYVGIKRGKNNKFTFDIKSSAELLAGEE